MPSKHGSVSSSRNAGPDKMDRLDKRIGFFSRLSGAPSQSLAVSWPYVLLAIAVAILIIGALAGILFYFAYGTKNKPHKELTLSNIGKSATIQWYENKATTIKAGDKASALAALGYVHATQSPWQMALWRQTANGRLTRWFGPNQLSLDRLAYQLQFASLARKTYEALPQQERAWLAAYAEGVNAAFTEDRLIKQNDFALLGKQPQPWQPWDALSLERLFSWLGTNLPDSIATKNQKAWHALKEQDIALRNWLHLHHFRFSIAGAWNSGQKTFFSRTVYGDTASPLFQEVNLMLPGHSALFISTIPGTFLFFSGLSPSFSWSIIPSSTITPQIEAQTWQPEITYNRLVNRDGSEFLARFRHYPGKLVLNPQPDSANPSAALYWKGLEPITDLKSFMQLLDGTTIPFDLFDGDGLLAEDGVNKVLGNPDTSYAIKDGLLIGKSPWMPDIAAHLDSLLKEENLMVTPEIWDTDCYSRWAADQTKNLLARLQPELEFEEQIYDDGLTYLRNWDYSYSKSSIGASIFEYWLTEIDRDSSGKSTPEASLTTSFTATIDRLAQHFSSDISQWRLEITRPGYRHFAARSSDSTRATSDNPLSQVRYNPLSFPGKGHPSTLCWGAFYTDDAFMLSSARDAWSQLADGKFTVNWRRNSIPEAFLERYLISNRPNLTFTFSSVDQPQYTTSMVPRQ